MKSVDNFSDFKFDSIPHRVPAKWTAICNFQLLARVGSGCPRRQGCDYSPQLARRRRYGLPPLKSHWQDSRDPEMKGLCLYVKGHSGSTLLGRRPRLSLAHQVALCARSGLRIEHILDMETQYT